MPELPEVETTRRGLERLIVGQTLVDVDVRDARLRWPVPAGLSARMGGQRITALARRAKYLLWSMSGGGTCLVHLGMSGSLRVVTGDTPLGAHDHVRWRLGDGREVRLRDPRRFGSVLWLTGDPHTHPLLRHLGPEPLGNAFDAGWLFSRSRRRRAAVKNFIMDAHQVVGVGNIYASESLFRAGIRPGRAAGRVTRQRYELLVTAIRGVLNDALAAGGTTLRDFARNDGEPGYFAQSLAVYGRDGQPCLTCGATIRRKILGQRSTFYCASCQS